MDRDASLLREFQISLVAGGAMVAFVVLDVVLAATAVYPWGDAGPAVARVGIAAVLAALAFGNARRVWRQRADRDLGGVTFNEAVMVLGFMAVGGVLLLAMLR